MDLEFISLINIYKVLSLYKKLGLCLIILGNLVKIFDCGMLYNFENANLQSFPVEKSHLIILKIWWSLVFRENSFTA